MSAIRWNDYDALAVHGQPPTQRPDAEVPYDKRGPGSIRPMSPDANEHSREAEFTRLLLQQPWIEVLLRDRYLGFVSNEWAELFAYELIAPEEQGIALRCFRLNRHESLLAVQPFARLQQKPRCAARTPTLDESERHVASRGRP